MKSSFKGLSIWQIICLAAKDGFRSGRSRVREKAKSARQLRADELRRLRADRAERNRRQN
mgnify:FL=1